MAVTLQDLLTDPGLFLYELDKDDAIFQSMTREDLFRSIFLDARIRHSGGPNFRVPLNALLAAFEKAAVPAPRIGWIFHVAQCGSTLLARALDHPGRSLVLREPAALRRLGVMAGAGARSEWPEPLGRLVSLVATMLGKHWETETATIVKANVPVNFIASDLLARDPGAPAILLHFPLANYVGAILRTEGHVRWTESVFAELRLHESPYSAGAEPRSAPEKAAALWFAQMKAFEALLETYPATRSLDATLLFGEPAQAIEAATRLFGLSLRDGEAQAIAGSDLFHSYSKNPALDYDPEVRLAREAEALHRLEAEIDEARAWAKGARARHGLPEALDRPLVGPLALLLS